MKIEFLTRSYTLTEDFKEVLTRKIDRLDKFIDPSTKIKVLLKALRDDYIMELTIVMAHSVLRAEVSSDNMSSNIDLALPKLEKQILKYNQRSISKKKRDRSKLGEALESEAQTDGAIVRTKSFVLNSLSVDQAVEEMELVGHSFYVFLNAQTRQVNVAYKRKDGDYGIIEALTE